MTTSTKELIKEADRMAEAVRMHSLPSGGNVCELFTNLAQRLRELESQVTELELKLLTERGAKAWKDVPDATAFVEGLRGNSDKPDCVWKITYEDGEQYYESPCDNMLQTGGLTPFCLNCGGAVKSGGTPNE